MASFIAVANGNLTAAATWGQTSVAALLDSEAGSTGLTAANQDSSTFVLEANQIDGFAIKLASRGGGAPTNTVTFILRNTTAGTNIWSVTLNVSDLDFCTNGGQLGDHEGGWYFINGGSLHTPNGTDSYVIRVLMNNTTTAVSLWTNGVGANWSRIVRRTATASPAAGDNMHIIGEWTAAATMTARTVTMDQTAATDYGSGSVSATIGAVTVNKGGTLTWGTAAATNYVLQLHGNLKVFSSGTYKMGDAGAEIPRTSTATLQFSCTANNDFGVYVHNGATFKAYGLSRTSGKNIWKTKLTATIAIAGTTANVADDTGWLNGDAVVIAATTNTGTATNNEEVTLNANAGASSFTWVGGLATAHLGDTASGLQGDCLLLTRNVVITVTTKDGAHQTFFSPGNASTLTCSWVQFRELSGSNIGSGAIMLAPLLVNGVTATWTWDFCILHTHNTIGWRLAFPASNGTVTLTRCFGYKGSSYSIYIEGSGTGNSAITYDDCFVCRGSGYQFNSLGNEAAAQGLIVVGKLTSSGSGGTGIQIGMSNETGYAGHTMGPFEAYGNGSYGIIINNLCAWNLDGGATSKGWHNGNAGLLVQTQVIGGFIKDILVAGNDRGFETQDVEGLRIAKLRGYGTTTYNQPRGVRTLGMTPNLIRIENGELGVAAGILVAHTVFDIGIAGASAVQLTVINVKLGSTTKFDSVNSLIRGNLKGNFEYVAFERYNQTAGDHRLYMLHGTVFINTSVFDVSPSIQMTPTAPASFWLTKLTHMHPITGEGAFHVPVTNGQQPTISVKVQKDGSYSGNAPRLMLRQNSALGIDADTVLATFSAGSGVFQTLSAAIPSPVTDDGVVECYVDCDGSAGNIYVDTFKAS